ncbi:SIR2 family protein [Rouxiella badensis]|nr:SIR2 family protein [Rouxiella badensis]
MNNYKDLVDSLILDIKRKNKISFILGSATTMSPDGKGVPGVKEINEIIKEYMISFDIYDNFIHGRNEMSVVETYQQSFEYLLRVGDQDMVKEVFAIIMGKAKPDDTNWYISKCINDLTTLIFETEIDVGIILTTNFDEVIEYSLYKAGREPIIKDLILDQPIQGTQGYTDKEIVVHLHGIWNRDTMHTSSQLTALRPKIESSIKQVLSDSKLYVLGYAGWDDVFIQSLTSVVNNYDARYNIRWAFYEPVAEKVKEDNKALLNSVSDAIANGRFQGYCGVDCHRFFEDVLAAQKKVTTPTPNGLILTHRPVVPALKQPKLTVHILSRDPSHEIIRLSEQWVAAQALHNTGSLELICGWGYGKTGFLYSFLNDEFEKITILYSDLTGLTTVDEISRKIGLDTGADITSIFYNNIPGEVVIILDNISSISSAAQTFLHELSKLTADYNSSIKIIFIGTNSYSLCSEQLNLNPLSVDDVKEYLRSESELINLSREQLDKILEITAGLPSKLDKLKDYLRLMSLDEVLNDGVIRLPEEEFSAEIPSHWISKIENLKLDHKNIHSLLEIFAVLDCGERLKNIRENFSDRNYIYNDFSKLERDGLIYSIHIKNEKILKINPLVRDYISSFMSKESYIFLVEKCLSVCIGSNWMSGNIKIGPVTQFMLYHTEFYPGNVHTLIRNYLELTEFDLESRGTKSIILASIGYCMFLNHNDYFKELVSFSRMVFQRVSSSECNEKYQLAWYLASGLRMIDEDKECADFLEPILQEFEKSEHNSRLMVVKMMTTIMHSLSNIDRVKSLAYARKIKSIANKNTGYAMSAEAELIEEYPRDQRVNKFIRLERKARKNLEIITANNISLSIYTLLSNKRDKYVDSVINHRETGVYTRVRGLLCKYESILSEGEYESITPKVVDDLKHAYDYLFTQRLDSLFNKCSELLWNIAINTGDVGYLYTLFKSSSIIWRVTSAPEKELVFANALVDFIKPSHIEQDEVKYLQIRISVLSNNFQSGHDDSVVAEQ